MDCIKKHDLMRRVLMTGICLLVIWPYLWGPCPVFAFEVLPENPFILEQDPNQKINRNRNTKVASDGQRFFCVWQQNTDETGDDILGKIVDPNGSEGDIIIKQSIGNQVEPDIDYDGQNYLVVWFDGGDPNIAADPNIGIYGSLIRPNGAVLRKEIPIEKDSSELRFPKVKWNGEHYLVAWEDWKEHAPPEKIKVLIYGKRVDPNGDVLDLESEEIAVNSAFNKTGSRACFDIASLEDPNIASWIIVWSGNLYNDPNIGLDIMGRLIYEDPNAGIYLDPPIDKYPIYIPSFFNYLSFTSEYNPSVEGLGNRYMIVWENWTKSEEEIRKDIWGIQLELDAQGRILNNNIMDICSASNSQTFPEVATNGKVFFVVWLDRRDSISDQVYGARFSPGGIPLPDGDLDPNTPIGTRISTGSNQISHPPAVASTGSGDDPYLCFWPTSNQGGTEWSLTGRLYYPPPPPQLEWLGANVANYEEDGVDPNNAPGGSPFTFKVKYLSPEAINEPPEVAHNIWIDLDDNGNFGEGEFFELSVEDGSEANYTTGVVYSLKDKEILYDGDGNLGYRFIFMDRYNVAMGKPTQYNSFQVSLDRNQPTLDWIDRPGFKKDGARPDGAEWSIEKESTFEFRVTYKDGDNDPPVTMELWIDKNGDSKFDPNERLVMTADGSLYKQGQIYKKAVNLWWYKERPFIYKFEFDDGKNKATGDPRAGSYLSINPLGETSACLNMYNQFFPSIASTGTVYQVFWEDKRENEPDANDVSHIWKELISGAGDVKDGDSDPGQSKVDNSSKGAFKPLAQFDPNTQKTLVIWEDLRNGFLIKPNGDEENNFKPETIYDGLEIYGIFIDADGEPLIDPNHPDSEGEFIIGGEANPRNMINADMALGKNGQYLIVWESESRIDVETEKTEIWARFVRYPEGPIGDEIWIKIAVEGRDWPGEGHQLMPKVACNGDYYLAVWQDVASIDLNKGYHFSRVYGMRIDPNGELYPPVSVDEITLKLLPGTMYAYKFFNDNILSDPNKNQLFPDIASDGENFLIVWQDSRNLGKDGGYDIFGMRVNVNGDAIQYLDKPNWEIPICTADGDQVRPRVYWDPQEGQYIIMWLETFYPQLPGNQLPADLRFYLSDPNNKEFYARFPSHMGSVKVVRMDPNGQLIDDTSGKEDKYEGTSLVGVSQTQSRPDMVCDPNLGCRIIWEDVRNNLSYDIYTASYQSTLNWTGDPNFENRGVDPIQGTSGDTFTFKVEYRDRSDMPAKVHQIWIDLDDNGEFGEEEEFEMSAVDPNGPVSEGMIYTFTEEIDFPPKSDGRIAYRFYFENEKDQKVQGLGSGLNFLSLKLTEVPQLDWAGESGFISDGVEPNQGKSGDRFIFKVKYINPDNSPPDQGKTQVWIDVDANDIYEDDEKFNMNPVSSEDTVYTDGKIYTYAKNISYAGDGRIKYRFDFMVEGSEITGSPSNDHYLFIVREKSWKMYTMEDNLSSNFITSLVVDNQGRIWAGTWPLLGLTVPSGGGSITDPYYDSNNQGIQPPSGQDTQPGISVTAPGGINIYDGSNWKAYYETDPNALGFNYINCLTKDQNGNIWAGTYNGLIKYINADPSRKSKYTVEKFPKLGSNFITTLAAGIDNDIWIATGPKLKDPNEGILTAGGVTRFDGQTWTRYDPNKLEDNNTITALAVDGEGKVWMGLVEQAYVKELIDSKWELVPNNTFYGLGVLDPDSEGITRYTAENTKDLLDDDHISDIFIGNGDVWIATGKDIMFWGIYPSDMSTSNMGLIYYSNGEWREKFNSENTSGKMLGNDVTSLFVHEGSDIWMGILKADPNQGGGISHFDYTEDEWESFMPGDVIGELSSPFIIDILVDNNEEVWAATPLGVARYGYIESPEEELRPYRGLDPNEESGCFINRIGKNSNKINNRVIILFSLIMSVFLILIGSVFRRKTMKIKKISKDKKHDRYGI